MNAQLLEQIKKRIAEFNAKHDANLDLILPLKMETPVLGLIGEVEIMQKFNNYLIHIFDDKKIFHFMEYTLEYPNQPQTLMYMYAIN